MARVLRRIENSYILVPNSTVVVEMNSTVANQEREGLHLDIFILRRYFQDFTGTIM